jgi:hypothetical protein
MSNQTISNRHSKYGFKPNERERGKFVPKFDQPLSKKAYATRLPLDVAEKIEQLGDKKGEWLREIISAAANDLPDPQECQS